MWAKKYLTFHLSQSASSIISGSPSQQVWEQKHESINISSHPRITPISELTKPQPKPWFSFGNHLSLTVIIVVIGGGVVHSFTTLHFYLHKYFKPSFCISILSVSLSLSLSLIEMIHQRRDQTRPHLSNVHKYIEPHYNGFNSLTSLMFDYPHFFSGSLYLYMIKAHNPIFFSFFFFFPNLLAWKWPVIKETKGFTSQPQQWRKYIEL